MAIPKINWNNADGYLRKYGPVFQLLFILFLIVLEIISPQHIVTWQLVALMVILIITPYIPLIKRVRYGDWEAEIESLLVQAERKIDEPEIAESTSSKTEEGERAEIEETDEESSESEQTEMSSTDSEESEETISPLRKMANADQRIAQFKDQSEYYLTDDPIVALSHLRMELDRTLVALAEQHGIEYRSELGMPLQALIHSEVLSKKDVKDIQQIYEIANKAIHGEEVKKETAERILKLSERVLKRLYIQIDANISTDPSEPPIETDSEIG